MTRAILRIIAFGIAIAALIDPSIAVSGASRARIAVVVSKPAPPDADSVRDRVTRALGSAFEIVPAITSDAAAAVVVGDRYPADPIPDALLAATVTTPESAPGVRILRVDAPAEVPAATTIHVEVELEGAGVNGQTTDVIVAIGGLEAGRASHRWTADKERWRARIDAVPVGAPPFVLNVRLKPDATNAADVLIAPRATPFRVQFYEPRPSWATTFIRRALEADPRFQSSSLSFSSRGISARTGDELPLNDPRIDAFAVVIVGGLELLSSADARALDRFMRERGGAVVVAPDQKITTGPARELVSGSVRLAESAQATSARQPDFVERLLEQPATLSSPAASLQASELLVIRGLTPGSDVIARVPGEDNLPVIAAMPRGDGRLLVSGAMDAWRFRAAGNNAFDHFWQSTIAGLALAVPPPIEISVEPPLLQPGESGEVIVRVRAHDTASVRASLDGDQPIRLVPEPETGVYRGRFTAKSAPGRSTIEVHTEGGQARSASRALMVQADVRRAASQTPALAMLASSHRGIDISADHLADLERFFRGAINAPRTTSVRHPMRSAWWMLPFAICLSVEWWLRRRQGLR